MKIKTFSFLSLICAIMLAVFALPCFVLQNCKIVSAASENSILSIDLYTRQSPDEKAQKPDVYEYKSDQSSENKENAYIYNWADVEKFKISLNLDSSASYTPLYEGGTPYYQASLDIEFFKGYKEDQGGFYQAEEFSLNNFYHEEARGENNLTELNVKFQKEFIIDAENSQTKEDGSLKTVQGWGIYRFILKINNVVVSRSDFYIIEPTLQLSEEDAPVATYTVETASDSYRQTYKFTLENIDKYKYIDENQLIWYAKGVTQDGSNYCLMQEDLSNPNFSDCTASIYESNRKRTGFEFIFDDNGNHGEWQIWCEYTGCSVPSQRIPISTKVTLNYMIFVYVGIAALSLAIITTIGICVFKIKKEKVY